VLCFGRDRGRRVTYAHPRRWTGEQPAVSADEGGPLARGRVARLVRTGGGRGLRSLGRSANRLGAACAHRRLPAGNPSSRRPASRGAGPAVLRRIRGGLPPQVAAVGRAGPAASPNAQRTVRQCLPSGRAIRPRLPAGALLVHLVRRARYLT
jgi:hypothetical protein